ncbi:hypothetical protein ACHHYP_20579 [Achlya hypogyna]|uniref:MULE transposase domain-containing protein n=1 Tax=Achlya hypogyna TaxID=1202772 RepID=A0A1V9ZHU0_ACHHY|nr:hypothetical protein ACHHYP_20579 [Achlya hypogyna]
MYRAKDMCNAAAEGEYHVVGIDGARMKSRDFPGTMLVLVGRNGDNRNVVLAVALVPSETAEAYDWFLSSCQKNDVQLDGTPILCDRGTAILASRTAFFSTLARLGQSLPSAAAYDNKIDPTTWAIYPHIHTTPLYGWRTTNFVESTNSEALPARDMDPFHFLLHYMEDMMTTAYTHRTKAQHVGGI